MNEEHANRLAEAYVSDPGYIAIHKTASTLDGRYDADELRYIAWLMEQVDENQPADGQK